MLDDLVLECNCDDTEAQLNEFLASSSSYSQLAVTDNQIPPNTIVGGTATYSRIAYFWEIQ